MSETFYKVISPEREWYWFPVFAILKLISFVYLLGHHFRLWAYRWGVFPSRKLDCRVISVGNLTLGGTGKTPFVMMIAETPQRERIQARYSHSGLWREIR